MDIAVAHILHDNILNADNKNIHGIESSKDSIIVTKEGYISPIRSKACPRCGQSIYFCNCPESKII